MMSQENQLGEHTNEPKSQNPRFSAISVNGLYGRLDFVVKLYQNMNIIYGKNGRGKTTLLHIIANLMELDFSRFKSLSFDRIEARTDSGTVIEIVKSQTAEVSVFVDGKNIPLLEDDDGISGISDAHKRHLREALGDRPAYLPAFRSVLERARESRYGAYQERKSALFEHIVSMERDAITEANRKDYVGRGDAERCYSTVSKTLQCREWFGEFVPIIRYPSILDVMDGLSEEWRNAQLAITRREQLLFEEAFLEIFEAIASGGVQQETGSQKDILASINKLLTSETSETIGPSRSATYDRLVSVALQAEQAEAKYNSLLEIYHKVLQKRMNVRNTALQPLKEYEASVNKFLDQKKLRIGSKGISDHPSRMRRSYVAAVSDSGKPYHLTALSSGERQIATMLYSATRSDIPAGAFLIDEPELSLHVDWQRIILSEIQQQYPDRQIIACTHSPEVGADHSEFVQFFEPSPSVTREPEFDPDGEDF